MSNAKAKATYLVVGAGTAGMSFTDSLLTLDAKVTVVLVDILLEKAGVVGIKDTCWGLLF